MPTPAHENYYREKAAELRQLANSLTIDGAKKDIEALATLYDRLADTIDAIDARRTGQSRVPFGLRKRKP